MHTFDQALQTNGGHLKKSNSYLKFTPKTKNELKVKKQIKVNP